MRKKDNYSFVYKFLKNSDNEYWQQKLFEKAFINNHEGIIIITE